MSTATEPIDEILKKKYDAGFITDIEQEYAPPGLNEEIVAFISKKKGEPQWMLDFRLKAYEHFRSRPMPTWGPDLSGLDLENIYYYVKPTEGSEKNWDDVPDDIKNTFDKLGIPDSFEYNGIV